MEQHTENENTDKPANKPTKADDFDKEKAAADQAENNSSNTNKTTTSKEDDVLREQKETD